MKKDTDYYLVNHPYGFGYFIFKKTFEKKKVTIISNKKKSKIDSTERKLMFHSSNQQQAKEVLESLKLNGDSIVFPIPENNWKPVILKFNEKHYDKYYLANNEDELNEIAFQILKDRNDNGWYLKPKFENFSFSGFKELPKDVLKKMDKSTLSFYETQKSGYEKNLKEFNQYSKIYNELLRVLKTKDKKAALNTLENYNSGEYECFEKISYFTIEDFK